jgi:hypothetical protein
MTERILPEAINFYRDGPCLIRIQIVCDRLALDDQASKIMQAVDGAIDAKTFITLELGPDGVIRDYAVVHIRTETLGRSRGPG